MWKVSSAWSSVESGDPITTQTTKIPATSAPGLQREAGSGESFRMPGERMSTYWRFAVCEALRAGACPAGCSVSRNATSAVVSAGLRLFP